MKSIEGIKNSIKAIEEKHQSQTQTLTFYSEKEREEYMRNHPELERYKKVITIVFTEKDRQML